jgi:peptidoglycan/xylan/chitin deacetylase (PgdA/CDA1 family)
MRSMGLRTRLASPWLVRRLPPAGRGVVLLTFDDGPTPGITDGVLDRLAEYGARGLFFVVGERVVQNPGPLRRVVAGGHAVGNHSHTHAMEQWPPLARYLSDLDRCSEAVRDAAGVLPVAFRAPGGRMHAASTLAPRRRGLPHVHWSLDPRDYACEGEGAARELGARVAGEVRDRDIVLLHDVGPEVLALLDVLLPRLRERGFDLAAGLRLLWPKGNWS